MMKSSGSDIAPKKPGVRSVITTICRDRLLLILISLQIIAGIPYLVPSLFNEAFASDYEDAFVDVILGAITLAAFVTCLRVRSLHRERRLFQWALTAGMFVWVIAKLSMGFAPDQYTESEAGNAIFDGLLALGMSLFLVAAEMQPDRKAGWTDKNHPFRGRLVAVLFSVTSLYTYFTLAPWLSGSPESDGWGRSLFLFIPFDAFLVLRFGWLRAFSVQPQWRLIYGSLTLVGLLLLGVDIVELMTQEDWISWIGLEPLGLIWFLPYIGFTLTARFIAACPPQNTDRPADPPSRVDSANAEIVIVGLILAILAVHFIGPLTGVLAPSLVPVRNLIALSSMCLLGVMSLIQAFSLGRHNRALNKEIEAMNAQLLQSQKMEAVGRLAGGMAHDFNNILTVVMGNEELLRDIVSEDPDAHEHVCAIGEACNRASALTSQLLAFSKDHVQPPISMDLSIVIRRLADMLQRLIDSSIRLQIVEKSNAVWIFANQTQIEQVLMNLCVNARDAMPDGGILTIELDIENIGDTAVERSAVGEGSHAIVTVRDTGCGMSDEVQARIFEPFYSTKPRHLGTGLGLSTAYAIVEKSNGQVTVKSAPGQGATFKITLPLTDRVPELIAEMENHGPVLRGHETILVVEDNPPVRNVACGILRNHGYQVLSASSGKEAIRLAEDHPSEIQLILADVLMPEMSGPETVEYVRKSRPGIKILFMSGHTGEEIRDGKIEELQAGFIQKPFKLSDLIARIQTLIKEDRRNS
ncbi:ATP-binding protein [bacterium]|nr:ATP-binding protein [bacterium]